MHRWLWRCASQLCPRVRRIFRHILCASSPISAPGSAIDVPVRIIADGLSKIWGQQAVVINQPGAGGAIAVRSGETATPDGYTFGVAAASAFVTLPGAADNLPVQVPKDFVPVGYLGGAPMFITAAPWLGVKTLPDLIALAKLKPGDVSYGVNGIGRLTHLTGELLQSRAGIKLLMVPYSGGTAQITQRHDGQARRARVRFLFGHCRRGRRRQCHSARGRLGKPAYMFPDLPTVAETLPGFEAAGWQVLMAPPGTPDAIIAKVNADVIKAMSDPEAKKLAALGRDDRSMSPSQTLAFIQSEQQKWAPIVQQIGPVK